MVLNNGIPKDTCLDPANYAPEDVITKDVCIIGGGSSGTYTAIRLRDFNKSVVVVEAKNRLGGHCETSKDPDPGTTLDISVIVFGHLEEVKDYFARFDIPLSLCHLPGLCALLEMSTIYVFKYFNLDLVNTLGRGFLSTESNNTGELYEKAAASLGPDALLGTTLVSMDRSSPSGPVRLLVQTPLGRKLILAQRIISTIPLLPANLHAFDLSPAEASLFAQHTHSAYYTGALRHTGLHAHPPIYAHAPTSRASTP